MGVFWKVDLGFWNFGYDLGGVGGDVWRWLCRNVHWKISAGVDGAPSRGTSGSKDPNWCQRKFPPCTYMFSTMHFNLPTTFAYKQMSMFKKWVPKSKNKPCHQMTVPIKRDLFKCSFYDCSSSCNDVTSLFINIFLGQETYPYMTRIITML